MNIFVLDRDPELAAKYHCDKHVVKMVLESAQMMCAAHWMSHLRKNDLSLSDFKRVRDAQQWLFENMPSQDQPPWKLSHARHPCTVWTAESTENYKWHSKLGLYLCKEYTDRYRKIHKSEAVHLWLAKNIPDLPSQSFTAHPICMPEDAKSADPVESYRKYYQEYKSHFAKWKTQVPKWWNPI